MNNWKILVFIIAGYLFYDDGYHADNNLVEVKSKGSEFYSDSTIYQIIKSYQPIPKYGKFYYEVLVMNSDIINARFTIGVCTKDYTLSGQAVGYNPLSIGYDSLTNYGLIRSASLSFLVNYDAYNLVVIQVTINEPKSTVH